MSTTATIAAENIPQELRDLAQWVAWRYEEREGKPTKVPYRADGKGRASTTDTATWSSAEDALEVSDEFAGVGFVFSQSDPYFGVDLDGCRLENGLLTPAAASLILVLDSYTEWSVSGTGAHVIAKGSLGERRGRRKGGVEVYSAGRFFAMTGDHMVGTPREIR